ncbi:MAG: divergent polysaccharide deacetylase family protein [Geminicoccaceae bacterium]
MSVDDEVELVMPLPASLQEEVPAPTEMIHGVDRHSAGPGALPDEERSRPLPPVEIFTKLLEPTVYGRIPRRADDGSTSFRTYAAGAPGLRVADSEGTIGGQGGARVAIAVIDLGLDQQVSKQSIALPWALSFGVTPYVATTADWQRFMRWHGHEVFTMLPLESLDTANVDQGALALSAREDPASLLDGLARVMSRGAGYVGVAGNARGFAAEPGAFAPIAAELARRGLAFMELDGRFLEDIADESELPYLSMSMALDEELSPAAVDERLHDLERLALANGMATAYTGPVPVVLDRIWNWSRELASRGITLVPATSLMEPPGEP